MLFRQLGKALLSRLSCQPRIQNILCFLLAGLPVTLFNLRFLVGRILDGNQNMPHIHKNVAIVFFDVIFLQLFLKFLIISIDLFFGSFIFSNALIKIHGCDHLPLRTGQIIPKVTTKTGSILERSIH